jgi:peptidoglycan/LPS O-acetylase OafA/YrhL
MDEIIMKLIALVETTAPKLWEIALRQVGAENMRDQLLCWVLGIVVAILITALVFMWKDDEDTWAGGIIFCFFGALGLMVVIVLNIIAINMRLANPEYYAIQVLLNLAK